MDAGANVGGFTLDMAELFDRVHAFEPNPQILDRLRSVTADLSGVSVWPCALGAVNGELTLNLYTNHAHASVYGDDTLDTDPRGDPVEQIVVPVRVLESLWLEHPVDFMKVDVEGYEVDVLLGAEQVIRRWKPEMLVEIHSLVNRDAAWEILRRHGYSMTPIPHLHPHVNAGHMWIHARP